MRKIKNIRLKDYDYSQRGACFITVCTQNKECIFGNIENSRMALNEIGQMFERRGLNYHCIVSVL